MTCLTATICSILEDSTSVKFPFESKKRTGFISSRDKRRFNLVPVSRKKPLQWIPYHHELEMSMQTLQMWLKCEAFLSKIAFLQCLFHIYTLCFQSSPTWSSSLATGPCSQVLASSCLCNRTFLWSNRSLSPCLPQSSVGTGLPFTSNCLGLNMDENDCASNRKHPP